MNVEIELYQDWYVKLPGKSTVAKVQIVDISEMTVLLETEHNNALSMFGFDVPNIQQRYETAAVKWLEQL